MRQHALRQGKNMLMENSVWRKEEEKGAQKEKRNEDERKLSEE